MAVLASFFVMGAFVAGSAEGVALGVTAVVMGAVIGALGLGLGFAAGAAVCAKPVAAQNKPAVMTKTRS